MRLLQSSLCIMAGLVAFMVWKRKKKRGARSSYKRRVPVQLWSDGVQVDIEAFLDNARRTGQWVVAYDAGKYELVVGDFRLFVDLRKEEEFGFVLSHRWDPMIRSTMGPVPIPMLQASYKVETWVDFLNHFNLNEHSRRVMLDMGRLYLKKHTRALFFEAGTTPKERIDACCRAWMWQELSFGPQSHAYSSIEAVWLHWAVACGERVCLEACSDWLDVLVCLSSLAARCPKRQGAQLHSSPWSIPLSYLGHLRWQIANVILEVFSKFEALSLHADAAMEHELEHGTLRSLLHCVLSRNGQLHGIRSRWLPMADILLAADPEIGDERASPTSLARVLAIFNGIISAGHAAVAAVHRQKGTDPNYDSVVTFYGIYSLVASLLLGSCPASLSQSTAVLDMLRIGDEQLASAISNLRNPNIAWDRDRLPASFGVLCAERGAPCDAAGVSGLLMEATELHVGCVPEAVAGGVGLVVKRRVQLHLEGLTRTSQWEEAVAWLCGGMHEGLRCEGAELSGWKLGACTVKTWAAWPKAAAWGAASVRGYKGEYAISDYRLHSNHRADIFLVSDDGVGLFLEPRNNLPPQDFKAWLLRLPAHAPLHPPTP